jgi:hypothetical protein
LLLEYLDSMVSVKANRRSSLWPRVNGKLVRVPLGFRSIKRLCTVSSEGSEGLDFISDSVLNDEFPWSVKRGEVHRESKARKCAERASGHGRQRMM